MILQIPPELEQRLAAQAQAQGQDTQTFALALLERGKLEPTQEPPPALSPRQQAARAGYGMFAGDGRTVDDFLRERHEEAEREMQATNAPCGYG